MNWLCEPIMLLSNISLKTLFMNDNKLTTLQDWLITQSQMYGKGIVKIMSTTTGEMKAGVIAYNINLIFSCIEIQPDYYNTFPIVIFYTDQPVDFMPCDMKILDFTQKRFIAF